MEKNSNERASMSQQTIRAYLGYISIFDGKKASGSNGLKRTPIGTSLTYKNQVTEIE